MTSRLVQFLKGLVDCVWQFVALAPKHLAARSAISKAAPKHSSIAMKFGSMAELQTLHLAHLPPDLAVHLALYTEVQNAPYLRDQLLQGNQDFEYALIDASVVCSDVFYSKIRR